jgi:hypothetical protein
MRFANIWRDDNFRYSPQEGGGSPPAGTPDPNPQPQAGNTSQPQAGGEPATNDLTALPAWAQTLISQVRAEAATHRRKASEYERQQQAAEQARLAEQNRWEELAKQYKTDLDKLAAERDAERRKALVQAVALKHQLPADLAARLIGETEEELDADAGRLAKLIVPVSPATETGRAGAVKPQPLTIDELKRRKAAGGAYAGL